MRLSYWLSFALAGVLACAEDAPSVGDTPTARDKQSAGGSSSQADGGSKRDAGKTISGPAKTPNPGDEDPYNTCDKVSLRGAPNSPDILIVLDRSGSMIGYGDPRNAGKNRWRPSVNAVKALTSALSETVSFGLMLFPSPGSGGGGGIAIPGVGQFGGGGGNDCEPGVVDVPVMLGSAAEIAAKLDDSYPDVGRTPTARSLVAAKDALNTGTCGDCREVPKYVLLVTDGQPTCGTNGGDADVPATNAAIDDLTALGIKTYVIGYDTASDPEASAVMDGFAQHGGTGKHFPVEDEATLVAELTRIASDLVPCEFEMSTDIPDPSWVRVEIDKVTYEYGKDWTVEGRTIVLHPEGGACPKLRDAKAHDLRITRECEIVQLI